MASVNAFYNSCTSASGQYLALLCLSGFLDLFGVSIVIPFLPKHLRSLGESYTVVGFVSSIYGFLQFFSSPIVGNLSDRFGRKRILVASLCCTALSYLMMTNSLLSSSVLIIAFSRIPPGLLKHSQSLTKAEIARSTKALSYFNAASTTGFIVGPPLAGILMDRYAPRSGYSIAGQIAALAFFLNAVLVYRLLDDDDSAAGAAGRKAEATSTPIKAAASSNGVTNGHVCPTKSDDGNVPPSSRLALLRSWLTSSYSTMSISCARITAPPLSFIYIAKFMNSMALFMQRAAYLLFLETELRLSTSALGWLSSVAPLLTVLFAPAVTPVCSLFAKSSPRLQAICCLLEILSVVLLLAAPNVIFVVLSAIPHGFATAVGRVNYTSMSLLFGGKDSLGTLIGFDQSVLSFSRTIAPALAGLLMDFSLKLPLILSIFLLVPTALVFHYLSSYLSEKSFSVGKKLE